MKVLVCGGRDYGAHQNDWPFFCDVMAAILRHATVELIIHGAAKGADLMGQNWAMWHKVPEKAYPALWGTHGKAAGPIRNSLMLEDGKPDLVVAMLGGNGTADMVRKAKAAGVPVVQSVADVEAWANQLEESNES